MYFATIDLGTSTSRVYIVDSRGEIIGKGVRNVGVRNYSKTGNNKEIVEGLVEAFHESIFLSGLELNDIKFAISAGMITSEMGLYTVPHLQTPAGLEELAKGLVRVHDPAIFPIDIPLYFIPGVRNFFTEDTPHEDVGNLDFMRGEEVQVIGMLASKKYELPLTLVILSSHTKFIGIDGSGRITGSLTTISGQMYEAVKTETFIGKSIAKKSKIPDNYFDTKIIDNAYKWIMKSGFLRSLMMCRFLDVLLESEWYERQLFVEALLAAEDMKSLHQLYEMGVPAGSELVLVGKKDRCEIYSYLLKKHHNWEGNIHIVSNEFDIDKLNIFGSISIARKAGLLEKDDCKSVV